MLTGQADICRWHAARARLRGLSRIAAHWDALARHYELAEQISSFLAWNAQRLQPVEAFTSVANQASTSRAVKPAVSIEELATWRRKLGRRRRARTAKPARQ